MRAQLVVAVVWPAAAAAQPPAEPPPAPPPTTPATPPPPTAPTPPPSAPNDQRLRLDQQVDHYDWEGGVRRRGREPIERPRGFFVGGSLSYATMGKVEVATANMEGTADLPSVFGAELQAGYRFVPNFSAGLVSQLFFNLEPENEDAAREVVVFAQATGHLVLARQWDFNAFVAPGYSVLIVPGAANARGLAFRYGGGPMFHVTKHVSVVGEFSHQIGFQRTERRGDDVDMETSFFSLLAGVRFRL